LAPDGQVKWRAPLHGDGSPGGPNHLATPSFDTSVMNDGVAAAIASQAEIPGTHMLRPLARFSLSLAA
jgi:hypothetical protein